MTRKTKLLKQVSVGCLTLLLSGVPNALAVVSATTQLDRIPNQSIVDLERDDTDKVQVAEPDNTADVLATEIVKTEQVTSSTTKNDLSAPILKGANPKEGTAGIQYNENFTEVTGYTGKDTDIVIPKGVTRIGYQAFYNKGLKTVKIPNSVTSIACRAFCGNFLKEVTLSNSLAIIENYAFNQNYLTALVLPDSLTSLEDGAFSNNNLTSVVLPNSLTKIDEYVFFRNRLKAINMPSSVTSIGKLAFGKNQLTTVSIPDSVTSIGDSAFANNQLTTVNIPDSVTSVGDSTFVNNQLTTVSIPDSVTSIGGSAFANNQLTTVNIPDSVTSVGDSTFENNQLTTATIGDSVTSVGSRTFENNLLSKVYIGRVVTSIGESAFANNQLTTVSIPDSVIDIGRSAFEENNLETVSFGNSVKTIGRSAFQSNQLTTLKFPDSLTNIESDAFICNQLSRFSLPDSVIKIGSNIAMNQKSTTKLVRRDTYTLADLGISTYYKKNFPVKLLSNMPGVTIEGNTVRLDKGFTGDSFTMIWEAWDNQHSGSLTVKLVEAVKGSIAYLDDSGKELLAIKNVSSQVGDVFRWLTPELIAGYTVDMNRSQILITSDKGLQVISLKDKLLLTQIKNLEDLIDNLNQQPIATGTSSVEIRYVYTKNPVPKGQVAVKYVDEGGQAIANDKVLTGAIGTRYQTEQLAIDGYRFKTLNGKSTGEYSLAPQVVTYVYTKDDKQPVIPTPDDKKTDDKKPNSNQSDNKNAQEEKILAKQTTLETKETKTNQLPKTGESQTLNLAQVLVGIVILLLSMSLIGLDKKYKHSANR